MNLVIKIVKNFINKIVKKIATTIFPKKLKQKKYLKSRGKFKENQAKKMFHRGLNPFYIYQVGGVIRDTMLNIKPKDIDYVVVHYGIEDMLKAGFSQVGREFPVFINPINKREYALARVERKNGVGYRGFHCVVDKNISIEDDLRRRDLTINAMARNIKTREIIDPFGGQADLKAKILRHVSEAFAEDPLRILRLARFSARYNDFSIADETVELAKKLVQDGEVKNLTPARIWKEISRSLNENQPAKFFEFLQSINAFDDICPLPQILSKKNMQFSWNLLNTNAKNFNVLQQFCILLIIIIFNLYAQNNNNLIFKNISEVYANFYQYIEIICKNFDTPIRFQKSATLCFKILESIRIPKDLYLYTKQENNENNSKNLANYIDTKFLKAPCKMVRFINYTDYKRNKKYVIEILPVINFLLNSITNNLTANFLQQLEQILDNFESNFKPAKIVQNLKENQQEHLIKQVIQKEKIKFFVAILKNNNNPRDS